jgi:hypothetical protein
MNTLLLAAACLILLVGAAHSYLGERYIFVRLFRRTDLPKLFGSDLFTRRTLRFAWHLTTVSWWGLAALLAVTAASRSGTVSLGEIGAVLGATSLVSAVVAFVGSRGKHLSWIAFLAIAALAWLGSR